jgi:methionyl-tRNA formyltransferase
MTPIGAAAPRVLFLGTPSFAIPSLRALARAAAVVAVVTQPDRPAGRGRRLTAPPVAEEARALGVLLLQPATLRTAAVTETLAALQPDVLASAAYGRLIPRAVLDIPRLASVNVHPSLLPAYRGASPIQAALLDGAATTGVTIMHLADELDAGDIILQRDVAIGSDETAGELEARLAEVGASLLVEAVGLLTRGEAPRRPQDHARASYAGKVTKADGELHWERPAREIVNRVRAMNPWPCAYTSWREGTLRVWRASVDEGSGPPGTVLRVGPDGVAVAAGVGAVRLLEVQREGGRRLTAAAFVHGHHLRPGERLGAPARAPGGGDEVVE